MLLWRNKTSCSRATHVFFFFCCEFFLFCVPKKAAEKPRVLPGGSRGSPGWSGMCRRRILQPSPPTRSRSAPENQRQTLFRAPCCLLSVTQSVVKQTCYLKQQFSLWEADSIDGRYLGGGGGGGWRSDACGGGRLRVWDVSPEHQAPLTGPAGAVWAFLHGGWKWRRRYFLNAQTKRKLGIFFRDVRTF